MVSGKIIKLKDIADIEMGQSPKGNTYNSDNNGMPFLQGNKTFGRLYPIIDTWTTDPKKIGKRNSILMSVRAPVGEINIANQDICIGRGLCSISMKNGNTKYLYYVLKNSISQIKSKTTGTVFDSINKKELENIEIVDFDTTAQNKIIKILSQVDDKIELNNEINDNLLDICQSLYKKWFVDFQFDNCNRNLKESEKGLIPYDWSVKQIQDIVEIKRGASPRPIQEYLSNEGINWLKIADVTGVKEPYIYTIKEKIKESGKDKSRFINKGTLVVSNSATPGIPKFIEVDTCVHDGWLILQGYKEGYKEFLYFLILDIRNMLLKMANGSVFQNLKTDILKEYKFVNPPEEILNEFHKIVKPLMKKINANVQQNMSLNQLRETLLPKLMNGEIDLDKIEI